MARKLPHLILLTGDEFLRKKKIARLIEEILPGEQDRSLSLFRPDLKEMGVVEFLLQVKSFPMMGSKQLFIIDQLPKLKKDDLGLFADYFKNATDWSYVIFSLEQLEEGHAIEKMAQTYGEQINCVRDDKRSGLEFIHDRLKREGKTISKEAWQYLNEKTGGNLTLLDSCLEKLLLYAGDASRIELEMVNQLTDQWLIFDSYDLTDAICAKNPEKALQVFRFLYDLEDNAMMVIGLIHWQLKRLWQGKVILEESGEYEVAKVLKISSYRVSTFLSQIKRFSRSELKSAIDQLFEIDRKIKIGQLKGKEALEAFVIQIASPKRNASVSSLLFV